jgi:O-antigen/teichoic acid export membrane protein
MAVSLVVAAVNIVVLVLLPDALGRAVLGNVWPVIAPLMLPVAVWLGLTAAQSGVPPVLIGRHQFQVAMVAQVVGGVLSVTTLVIGAALGGTSGAVWGLAVGQAANGIAWWGGLMWHLTRGQGATDT